MSLFRRRSDLTEQQELQELEELHQLAIQVFTRRKERNWNQEELARRAGMTQGQIALIEAGEANPTARTLVKLASALACDIASLWLKVEQCVADAQEVAQSAYLMHAFFETGEAHFSIVIGSQETVEREAELAINYPPPREISNTRGEWDESLGNANASIALTA